EPRKCSSEADNVNAEQYDGTTENAKGEKLRFFVLKEGVENQKDEQAEEKKLKSSFSRSFCPTTVILHLADSKIQPRKTVPSGCITDQCGYRITHPVR